MSQNGAHSIAWFSILHSKLPNYLLTASQHYDEYEYQPCAEAEIVCDWSLFQYVNTICKHDGRESIIHLTLQVETDEC